MATLAYRNSQSLNQHPRNLHRTELGPLHIHDSCVAWSICVTPSNGTVPSLLTASWKPTLHAGLPCPPENKGMSLVLWQLGYHAFLKPMKVCLFLSQEDGRVDGGGWERGGSEVGERSGRREARGGCG